MTKVFYPQSSGSVGASQQVAITGIDPVDGVVRLVNPSGNGLSSVSFPGAAPNGTTYLRSDSDTYVKPPVGATHISCGIGGPVYFTIGRMA